MSLTRRNFLALSSVAAGSSALSTYSFAQLGRDYYPSDAALPTLPEAEFLEAADLTALDGDEQSLLVTLQGLVNRRRPRLYFYWGTDATNKTWLDTIHVPNRTTTDPWEFIPRYRSEVRGAVVYDPNLPDTVNLATSIASLRGGVIATSELAKRFNLEVLDDLRGRFTSGLAAYQWAFDHLWPQMSDRILTAISPANTVTVANVPWTMLLQESRPIHDASNKATYTLDLSSLLSGEAVYVRFQDAVPSDGWGPSVSQVTMSADGNTIASFQPGGAAEQPYLFDAGGSQTATGWRFADGNNYFIYRFTPPAGTKQLTLAVTMWNEFLVTGTSTAPSVQQANANFRDYIVATKAPVFWLDPEVPAEAALFAQILQGAKPDTPYLGWFPLGHEMTGVTLCGQHGSPVVAADFFINASVFAGVRAHIDSRITHPPVPKIENKIYLTMTMVEGDNIQYNQHRMRDMWDDAGRGLVPLNWSISVLLLDIAPGILRYYQRTRTKNDLLMAGPSGAGYTYPAVWPAADLEQFAKRTGIYMQRTGMDTLFAYNRDNSTDLPLSAEIVDRYKRNVPNLLGIVYNYEPQSQVSFVDGVPLATLLGVNDLASGKTALAQLGAAWDGKSPLFVAAGLESWNMLPTDAKALADSLGSEFEIVRGDTFLQMLRATQG